MVRYRPGTRRRDGSRRLAQRPRYHVGFTSQDIAELIESTPAYVRRLLRLGKIVFPGDPVGDYKALIEFVESYRARHELEPLVLNRTIAP